MIAAQNVATPATRHSRPLRPDELHALAIQQAAGAMMTDTGVREMLRQLRHQVGEEFLAAGFKREVNMLETAVQSGPFNETVTTTQYLFDPETQLVFEVEVQLIVASRPNDFGVARVQLEVLRPDVGGFTAARKDLLLVSRTLFDSKLIPDERRTDDPSSQLSAHLWGASLEASAVDRKAVVQAAISQLSGVLAR